MLKASYQKYQLQFIQPGATSRGIMTERTSWFLIVYNSENPAVTGIGECAPLPGLSRDDITGIEMKLDWLCNRIDQEDILDDPGLWNDPSLLFAVETALFDLHNGGTRLIFKNSFYSNGQGIPINGLIWMGSFEHMLKAIHSKLEQGYTCIKIKISAKDIENELDMIRQVRKSYGWDLEIRVDANGAYNYDTCMPVLLKLADLHIHSIEQPLPSGAYESMARLCKNSPIPVALDEDVVHWTQRNEKWKLIEWIHPHYLVLKPGLIGGFSETGQWIELAENNNIGWWITSALESNIGLNAIAQFSNQMHLSMVQGLGTGQVFSNNLNSPLVTRNGYLFYDSQKNWDLNFLTV
jgi:o-succinylbenzoate synthase